MDVQLPSRIGIDTQAIDELAAVVPADGSRATLNLASMNMAGQRGPPLQFDRVVRTMLEGLDGPPAINFILEIAGRVVDERVPPRDASPRRPRWRSEERRVGKEC